MDGNSNEKFADIIAEQRHLAKSFKWKPAVRRRLKLIDRLEAAHKREVEEAVARAVKAIPFRFSGHE